MGISSATLLEQQTSARDTASLERMHSTLISHLERIAMPDAAACRRAEEVQRLLVEAGRHRGVSVPDLLVAATAEHHGLTVLHFDHDFETISEITGQPTQWVLPPDRLPHNAPVGRRPRDSGVQIWLAQRSRDQRDRYVAGLVCAQCHRPIEDHRSGAVLFAVGPDGHVPADRWVVSHRHCARDWETRQPRLQRIVGTRLGPGWFTPESCHTRTGSRPV